MKRFGRGGLSFVMALVILIVILLVVASVAAILFLPVRTLTVDEQRSISVMSEIDRINFNSNVEIGMIQIGFADLAPNLVMMTVQGTGMLSMVSNQDPVQVTLSYTVDGNVLNAYANVSIDSITTGYTFTEMRTDILISKGLLTNIDAEAKIGNLKLLAQSGSVLGNVTVKTATGSSTVTMTSGAILKGDVLVETSTGATYLNWNNVDLRLDCTVHLKTTAGSVVANVTQYSSMAGNVTLNGQATTGGMTLNMNIRNPNSGRVASHTNIGEIEVEQKTGFSGPDTLLTSSNFAASGTQWFDVNLNTNTGGIKLNLSYQAQLT